MMNIIWMIIAVGLTALDQFVKMKVVSIASVGETFGSFTPLANLTYIQNKGAAFSILSGKLSFLSFLSIAFCIFVLIYWIIKKPSNLLLCLAGTLLFSGALGNAIDRIFRGFVVDYVNLTFLSFPVFNIADVAITVGAILMVVYVMLFDKEKKNG